MCAISIKLSISHKSTSCPLSLPPSLPPSLPIKLPLLYTYLILHYLTVLFFLGSSLSFMFDNDGSPSSWRGNKKNELPHTLAYKTLLFHKTLLVIRPFFFEGPSDHLQLLTHKTIGWGGREWVDKSTCPWSTNMCDSIS